MPRALLWLTWMKVYARVRRAFRVQGNTRKLVLLIVGIVAVLLWFGPVVLVHLTQAREASDLLEVYGPLAMVAFVLLSLLGLGGNDAAIAFQPAEVDLLFPAPFTRRQLLGYKLLSGMVNGLPAALLFSIFLSRHTGTWATGFLAFVLILWFAQSLSTAAALVKQLVGELAYTRARRAGIALALLAAGGLVAWLLRLEPVTDVREAVLRINGSPAGRVVLAPFRVFTSAAAAPSVAAALPWLGAGVAVNTLLTLLVLRLDADYLEASIRASERQAEAIRRARSGNLFNAPPTKGPARSASFGSRRRLGDASPIVARHSLTLRRGGKRWLVQIVVLGAVGWFMLSAFRRIEMPAEAQGWLGVGVLAYVTVILAAILRFDFRGDLDHLETLKSLPLTPMSITIGEVAAPVAVLTVVQLILISVMTLAMGWPVPFLVGAVAACPVLTVLVVGVENALFLLYPVRFQGRGVGDFSLIARQVLLMLGKGLIYGLCAALCFGAAFGVYAASGSLIAAGAVAWAVALACAAASLRAAATAFHRFDVSADMPS